MSRGRAAPVSRKHRDVEALFARAQQYHGSGLFSDAQAAYRQVLIKRPNHFDALQLLGLSEHQCGNSEAAAQALRRALLVDPRSAEAHANLGTVLVALRRPDQALTCCDAAITLKPDFADAYYTRGNALSRLKRFTDAVASYDRVISIDPQRADAWNNRGIALQELGRFTDAIASFDRVIALRPSLKAFVNRGGAFQLSRQPDQAIADFDAALALAPDDEAALSNRIFTLDFMADTDFPQHQAARSEWWRLIGSKIAEQYPPQHDNDRDATRRLVLGYVSADFKEHSAALSFRPVLENHDKTQFEIICYSGTPTEDAFTESFRKAASHWRDVSEWSDDRLADCIRADKVDILIDLSGHTEGNRLRTFARKPAPIQVTAWGHGTGTGLPTIDYVFSDSTAIPAEVRHLFAERICDLPCLMIVEPPPAELRSAVPPMTPNGYVTYGVLNRISKISDAAIAVWARILRSDVTSRLLIKDKSTDDASVRRLLLERFAGHGIAPERMSFEASTSREAHLAAHQRVDICLDPFPQGGGVTTWEALYMGVPVVAKLGNGVSARVAGAILSAIGLTDWVATDDDQYVDIALRSTPDLLRMLRRELPDRIDARCGPAAYTRAVEEAYQAMWKERCGELQRGRRDKDAEATCS
jgi:predicted O-linked N-acetylglucosamine transferase (SPINDLY family)